MLIEKSVCCSNCIFCVRQQNEFEEDEYWCRRYPQRVYVQQDEVCGEFERSSGFKEDGYSDLKTWLLKSRL